MQHSYSSTARPACIANRWTSRPSSTRHSHSSSQCSVLCDRESKNKINTPDLRAISVLSEDPPGHNVRVVTPRRSHTGSPSSRCDNLARHLLTSVPQALIPPLTRNHFGGPQATFEEPQATSSVPQATVAPFSRNRLPYESTPQANYNLKTKPQTTLTKSYKPIFRLPQAYVMVQIIFQVKPPPLPRTPHAPYDPPPGAPFPSKHPAVRTIVTAKWYSARRKNKTNIFDLPCGVSPLIEHPPGHHARVVAPRRSYPGGLSR